MSCHASHHTRVLSLRPAREAAASATAAAGPSGPGPSPGPVGAAPAPVAREPLWRHLVGGVLRRERLAQGRTLQDVADAARISMPYLSELERGRKEASSEVLAAAAHALGLGLADLLARGYGDLVEQARPRPATARATPGGAGASPAASSPAGSAPRAGEWGDDGEVADAADTAEVTVVAVLTAVDEPGCPSVPPAGPRAALRLGDVRLAA